MSNRPRLQIAERFKGLFLKPREEHVVTLQTGFQFVIGQMESKWPDLRLNEIIEALKRTALVATHRNNK